MLHASRGALTRVPGIGPRRANQLFALDPRGARDARDASEVKSAADLARGPRDVCVLILMGLSTGLTSLALRIGPNHISVEKW